MSLAATLFYKEIRQQGALALGMIFLCLLFQLAFFEIVRWAGESLHGEIFFYIALWSIILYAGAAAALAYSSEHADNTYTFLRKLPISPATIALGKVGWVFCGTIIVFIATMLICLSWMLWLGYDWSKLDIMFFVFTPAIAETFLWGFFWSTRCRIQINAILLTYLSPAIAITILTNFLLVPPDPAEAVISVFYYRLAIMFIVGVFAVRGLLHWFEFDKKPSLWNFVFFYRIPYPKSVCPPFRALVHQHIRHASLLYPFGILCFIVLSVIILCRPHLNDNSWMLDICFCVCVSSIFIFWGTIFSHDQKHDSYRFLSRLGIHEGKIWWSRILPAFCFYLLLMITVVFLEFREEHQRVENLFAEDYMRAAYQLFSHVTMVTTMMLIPVALGTFFSISFRSQMVSIALTFAGSMCTGWYAFFLLNWFGVQFWWTVFPIIIALLFASRLRATYWIRETFTWRSRWTPLIPLVVTILAILSILPFVRVYTVPYVSWPQIASALEQAELPERITRLTPEHRHALIVYMSEGIDSPEYRFAERFNKSRFPITQLLESDENFESAENEDLQKILAYRFPQEKQNAIDALLLEEYLLSEYFYQRGGWEYARTVSRTTLNENSPDAINTFYWFLKTFTPWEFTRWERLSRLKSIAIIIQTGNLPDSRALVNRLARIHQLDRSVIDTQNLNTRLVDDYAFQWARYRCRHYLHLVFSAIHLYYWEHDQTLPQSLDDLLGVYFDELPVHPLTGEPVQFQLISEWPDDQSFGVSERFVLGKYRQSPTDSVGHRTTETQSLLAVLSLGPLMFAILEPLEHSVDQE